MEIVGSYRDRCGKENLYSEVSSTKSKMVAFKKPVLIDENNILVVNC
jgi:hypothetical protein